jgi:threonine synthase
VTTNRLVCTACDESYGLDDPRWRCDCGAPLDITLQPAFDPYRIARRPPNMWRYREAIPLFHDASVVSFEEGLTPLLPMQFGERTVWIKQDHLFPTGSYKDRGASILISKVKELGIDRVVEDSSGNAGCAIAAYCARAGIACTIFVPQDTAAAKLAQIRLYGATLEQVPGTRQDTADAVWEAAQTTYYASHSWNPFFFQGTKTFAYEVCEQLGWQSPDVVVLPVGNGTLLLGAAIGFGELLGAGIVDRVPRLVGPTIAVGPTMAEGIAIARPIRGAQILHAVRESGGTFIGVSEDEIARALREMAALGFYIEPTSAATIAGVKRYLRESERDEQVISVFTGHGLKATEKMLKLGHQT